MYAEWGVGAGGGKVGTFAGDGDRFPKRQGEPADEHRDQRDEKFRLHQTGVRVRTGPTEQPATRPSKHPGKVPVARGGV